MGFSEALRRDALEYLGSDANSQAGFDKLEEALNLFRTIYATAEKATKLFDHDSGLYAQSIWIMTLSDEIGEALSKVQFTHE